jgi:putative transposase
MTKIDKPQTKTDLAKKLGVSRSSLYYKHKRPALDEEVKRQIEAVLVGHPAYGHKRIALELKLNKKRILRVMKKFGIKPYRRRVHPVKKDDLGKAPSHHENLIATFCPIVPDVVWVADFTYIRFHEYFIYVATYMDLYSREIVGWYISRYHTSSLVLAAWEHALTNPNHHTPTYSHTDQGSEYDSQIYEATITGAGTMISMSHKGSPWENGFQESFYNNFKLDLGDPNRFEHLGEFIEAINQTIVEYNEGRIHTTLKMSPANFRRLRDKQLSTQVKDKSSSEKGT